MQDLNLWCPGEDLNLHAQGTAPSRLRVYQFHHLGIFLNVLKVYISQYNLLQDLYYKTKLSIFTYAV